MLSNERDFTQCLCASSTDGVVECVHLCIFSLTGATSLVFEVLWSREFVTVFGNSSYAISIVLCAYMAGLGLGGLAGGSDKALGGTRPTGFGAVRSRHAGGLPGFVSLLGNHTTALDW
jgi:hypothetical protein